jgi:hypothetical protein
MPFEDDSSVGLDELLLDELGLVVLPLLDELGLLYVDVLLDDELGLLFVDVLLLEDELGLL